MYCCLMASVQQSRATHMMGADFEYTCVGKDSFYLYIKVYKDCKGSQMSPIAITIDGIGCAYTSSGTMTQLSCEDITGTCKGQCTKCGDKNNCNKDGKDNGVNPNCTYLYGIEKVTFGLLITFPSSLSKTCCKFRIGYSQANRNKQLTTCCSLTVFYSYAELNRCIKPCNSSPILTNDPIAILCKDNCITFNSGARDTIDFDSISYHLAEAYQSSYGNSAGYNAPYNYKLPISFKGFPKAKPTPGSPCSGFVLDSIGGDLTFMPNQQQVSEIVIDMKEWRYNNTTKKMEVIGITRRDMQIIVVAGCTNKPPEIKGPFSQTICAGEQVCFNDMKVTDPDSKDTVLVGWNFGIPKAKFTKKMVGRFEEWNLCWQTELTDASTNPYLFTIKASDDACPKPGTSSRSFSITVKKSPEATRVYTNIGCGIVRMRATPKGGVNAYKGGEFYKWTGPYPNGKVIGSGTRVAGFADTTFQFTKPGQYIVNFQIELYNCVWEYFDTIDVQPFLEMKLGPDTFVCIGQSFKVQANSKYNQGKVKYYWNGDSVVRADTMTYTPLKDTLITVTAIDSMGCIAIDSMVLAVKPLPIVNLGPDQRVCKPNGITFYAGTNNGIGYRTVLWTDGIGTSIGDSLIIVVYDSASIRLLMTDSNGCKNSDTVEARFNPILMVDGGPNKMICPGDTSWFHGTGAGIYTWINLTNGDTLSQDTSFYHVFTASTSVLLVGTVTYGGVICEDYDTVDIDLSHPAILSLAAKDQCADYGQIYLLMKTAKDPITGLGVNVSYTWGATDAVLKKCITNNTVDTRCLGGTYKWGFNQVGRWAVVVATTPKGCVTKDSVEVIVNPLPPVTFKQKRFCNVSPKFLLSAYGIPNSKNSAPLGEVWAGINSKGGKTVDREVPTNPNSDWYFYPSLADSGANVLTYTYTDDYGCDSAFSDTFWIMPIPVNILTPPTPICIYDGLQDMWKKTNAQPSDGVWQAGAILDSLKGLLDPTVAFPPPNIGLTPVDYPVLFRTNRSGCVDIDTIKIRINPIPPVLMPLHRDICWDSMPWPIPNYAPPTSWWYIDGDTINRSPATFVPQMETPGSIVHLRFVYIDPTTGCRNTDSFRITVQDTPWIRINPVGPICNGDTFQLSCQLVNATGVDWATAGTGTFSDQNSLTPSYRPSLQDALNGSVLVTATTTGNGVCNPNSDTFTLRIHPIPDPNFDGTPLEGCSPLLTLFDAKAKMPFYSYFWNFGDPISGSLNFDTTKTPTHLFENLSSVQRKYDISLRVVTDAGCDSTKVKLQYVTVNPWPRADFDPKPQKATIALPRIRFQNLTKYASEASTWGWEFGDAAGGKSTEKNPTYWYTNTDTGTYIVTLSVINEYGCTDTIQKPVKIGPEMTVFIPNAFSPDNMGPHRNNNFWVEADNYKGFEMWVFNRWGEEMFYGKERLPGWNGIFKGHPSQEDVYVYQVNIQNFEGRWFYYSGTVTLMR